MERQNGGAAVTAADDAAYQRAVQVARQAIADALREGTTFEELEGGLLERRIIAPLTREHARA